jgi:hypothetical protein
MYLKGGQFTVIAGLVPLIAMEPPATGQLNLLKEEQ